MIPCSTFTDNIPVSENGLRQILNIKKKELMCENKQISVTNYFSSAEKRNQSTKTSIPISTL